MDLLAPRTLLALALAGAVTVAAVGQAGAAPAGGRKPTFVRVVDVAGQAVGGAEVTFAGGNPQLGEDVLPVDVQVVASDARGRAQARLLPGLCYVTWALGPADQGQQLASRPARYFGAGAMLEVTCRAQAIQRLEPGDASAWDELGPLRYHLVTPHPGVDVELEPAADGSLSLPPIPLAVLEVRTAKGEPLWSGRALDFSGVPPPRQLPVRAVDEDGAPIAGARIRHRAARRSAWTLDGLTGLVQPRMRVVGITDAEGRATVVVPYAADPIREFLSSGGGEMMLFTDAPGRAVVAGGNYGNRRYIDDRRVEDPKADELVFTLPNVEPVAVKTGILPAGTVAQLVAVCKLWSRGNSYLHDPRTFTATVGDDGALAFDHVPADVHSMRLCLLLSDGPTACVFAGLDGRTLPPELVFGERQRLSGRVGTLRVRTFDVTGGPARGAVACVVPAARGAILQRNSAFQFPLDAAGRGSVQLGPGNWVAIVITAAGYAATAFELQPGLREVELRLQPLAIMQLVLRDGFGKPVEGARLRVAGSRTHSTADPSQNALRLFSRRLQSDWSQLRTGSGGELSVPFLPVDSVTWNVSLSWPGGSTDTFVVEATSAPIELSAK